MHFMCLKWSSLTHISTCFQDFGENFVDTTKDSNRPEIFQFKSASFLGNKSNESNNETFFKCTSSMEVMKKNFFSSLHTSTLLVGSNDETFCAWCFVSIHRVKLMKNFFLCVKSQVYRFGNQLAPPGVSSGGVQGSNDSNPSSPILTNLSIKNKNEKQVYRYIIYAKLHNISWIASWFSMIVFFFFLYNKVMSPMQIG